MRISDSSDWLWDEHAATQNFTPVSPLVTEGRWLAEQFYLDMVVKGSWFADTPTCQHKKSTWWQDSLHTLTTDANLYVMYIKHALLTPLERGRMQAVGSRSDDKCVTLIGKMTSLSASW